MRDAASPRPSGAFGRLARQSGLYTMGNALVKAGGLFLAPLYLTPAYLAVSAFAELDAAQTVALILTPVIGAGLSSGMLKFMADPSLEGEQEAVPATAFVLVLVLALVALALLWPAAPWVWDTLVSQRTASPRAAGTLARLTFTYAALKAVATIPLMRLQARERALLFSLAQAAEFAVLIGATWIFLAVWGMGLRGALWALVLSSALGTLAVSIGLVVFEPWRVHPGLARRLIRYGAPLVLAALSLPVLHAGDRLLLKQFASDEERALYAAAIRIAGVLNVVLVQGFQSAFSVLGLKTLAVGEGGALHRRTFRHLSVVGGGFALGLSLFARDAIGLLTDAPLYLRAAPLVFPLALGYVLYGLYIVGVNALFAQARTKLVALGVTAAAMANIVLNIALIPAFGAWGAALATLVSYGGLAVMVARISERIVEVRFPWKALIGVFIATTALFLIGYPFEQAPTLTRLGVRVLLMAAYPLSVLMLGVYRWHEVVEGVARLRKR